ncbi:MAG TPA: c(7)-type cytochrome triheme domain-containing protein [Desulfuromonadaceae bacterium]|jgi:c(7)-type cytochrome triheme protein
MKKICFLILLFFIGTSITWAEQGRKKRKPLPYEYGNAVINNFSKFEGMPPVTFDHWVHRQYYTCRLCHVDIGFGMTTGSTKITAEDNMKGFFCGTCHNGKMEVNKKKVFESCAKVYNREDRKRCVMCHTLEVTPAKKELFYKFVEKMPKENYGNGINWEKAELDGLIKPINQLQVNSGKKFNLRVSNDFALKSKVDGMPDIIFSHKKHTVWSGCEVCHPDLFMGIKKGTTKYNMVELFEGKYCGACHDKVAFPQTDCQRCHSTPVH